jgi:hypothetical protein
VVKQNADTAFENVCKALPKLYEDINVLISGLQVNPALANDTKSLIAQARDFSFKKDGNERIIAYANTIIENTRELVNGSSADDAERFGRLISDFEKIKNKYNNSAVKLRHYADVFPTSFYARLKKISIMDYLN